MECDEPIEVTPGVQTTEDNEVVGPQEVPVGLLQPQALPSCYHVMLKYYIIGAAAFPGKPPSGTTTNTNWKNNSNATIVNAVRNSKKTHHPSSFAVLCAVSIQAVLRSKKAE
ncbi:pachytene checkpoint protein 2 [Echinococcus multilocularis]|uniref:Pachytene checkpoint protein 2 n=1 Tax=Echinococcus multilocularis TaxID=6211 RepID=A0A068YP53_ECHMU|nr:pachytene checkpoint protein 2 [Echinococcus multilocularis]